MNKLFLSKTNYCKSIQCPKIIWLNKYKYEEKIQSANPILFENGKKVGLLAQNLFGKEHEDIHYNRNYRNMIKKTRKYLKNKPNIITEATFNYDNNFCMVDILKNDEDGVEIYEVKSSTKVTSIIIEDAAFQYYVLSNLGLKVKKVAIVYINNQYVRKKDLNIHELFNIEDITSKVIEKQDAIRDNIKMINNFMTEHNQHNEPSISMGKQCSKPYPCDFMEYCKKCSENRELSTKQSEQKNSIEKDETIINKEAIKEILDSLKYPLYFLDYETYMTPIPEIEGTKPYQHLPFQYSLHILSSSDATLEHKEFLAKSEDNDFIRHFTESLISNLSEEGSVIVYNKSFESARNNEIGQMYPEFKDNLERINRNMIDFMEPFKQKNYYTKEMQGSHSLKQVLPALFPDNPELNYSNLALVHEAQEASDTFSTLKEETPQKQEAIRQGLLDYCKLDTYAMVKIYEKFKEAIE